MKEAESSLDKVKRGLNRFTVKNFGFINNEEFEMRAVKIELLERNLEILLNNF